jgi:hypothetical protein
MSHCERLLVLVFLLAFSAAGAATMMLLPELLFAGSVRTSVTVLVASGACLYGASVLLRIVAPAADLYFL